MNGTIRVRPASERIASCNACLARNYDPVIETGVGESVDTLYEIYVSSGSSGLSFCLCRDCLCKLLGEVCIYTVFAAQNAAPTRQAQHGDGQQERYPATAGGNEAIGYSVRESDGKQDYKRVSRSKMGNPETAGNGRFIFCRCGCQTVCRSKSGGKP